MIAHLLGLPDRSNPRWSSTSSGSKPSSCTRNVLLQTKLDRLQNIVLLVIQHFGPPSPLSLEGAAMFHWRDIMSEPRLSTSLQKSGCAVFVHENTSLAVQHTAVHSTNFLQVKMFSELWCCGTTRRSCCCGSTSFGGLCCVVAKSTWALFSTKALLLLERGQHGQLQEKHEQLLLAPACALRCTCAEGA